MTSYAACALYGADNSRVMFTKNGYDLVKCHGCELVYVGNPPDQMELSRIYSFDSGYHEGLTKPGPQQEAFRRRAYEQFFHVKALRAPGKLLDIGCSVGFFMAVATGVRHQAL
jgi:hypothetical protein